MDKRNGPARPLIGAQISTAGGFVPVPERARAIGAEAVQVFVSNPRMWHRRVPSAEELSEFQAGLRAQGLPLFFHTIYLINLATPDEELRNRSVEALAHSLTLGGVAGAAGVVTHLGSHRGEGYERGTAHAVEAIGRAWRMAAESRGAADDEPTSLPPLLLETSTGGGASMGGRLEGLAELVAALDSRSASEADVPAGMADVPADAARRSAGAAPRFGVCLDTAHLFAAGYPIHEADGLENVVEELRGLGLLSRLGLVHLNDSSAPFASHWDRHDNPGEGQIGYEGLTRVVRHPALAQVPFVLETPGADGHGPDGPNVAVVKSMRAGKPRPKAWPPPRA